MDYVIKIDNELADDPALKQELARVVELALQAARERFYQKEQVLRRGVSRFDGNAVMKTAELEQQRDADFLAKFGRSRNS
jgi:hypothetical protein